MAREVCEIPCDRSIGQRNNIGEIDQRDIVQLSTSDALRLQNSEQTGLVKVLLGLRRKTPHLFSRCSAFSQFRNERMGTLQHLGIRVVLAARTPVQLVNGA